MKKEIDNNLMNKLVIKERINKQIKIHTNN